MDLYEGIAKLLEPCQALNSSNVLVIEKLLGLSENQLRVLYVKFLRISKYKMNWKEYKSLRQKCTLPKRVLNAKIRDGHQ